MKLNLGVFVIARNYILLLTNRNVIDLYVFGDVSIGCMPILH